MKLNDTRIIGVDLSLNSTGIAVLTGDEIETYRICPEGATNREKLADLYDQLHSLFDDIGWCDLVVIEESIISKYQDIVRKLGAVYGVFSAVLGSLNYDAHELSVHPTALKKRVTGDGRASKEDMIQAMYRKTGLDLQNDIADALALAYFGKAVGQAKVLYPQTKYAKIRTKRLEEDVFAEFGFTPDEMEAKRKEKDRGYRQKAKEKRQREKDS